MTVIFLLLVIITILFCCWQFLLVVFFSGRRKRAFKFFWFGLVASVVFAIFFSMSVDQDSQKEGFLNFADQMQAEEAGFDNSEDWQVERERLFVELKEKQKVQAEPETIKKAEDEQKQAELDIIPKVEAEQKIADDGAYISNRFCYAIAAMSNCNDFLVKGDKEEQLEKAVGAKLRFEGSPFKDECSAGYDRFWDQMSKEGEESACFAAWDAVGPMGNELSGLLIEDPFNN